MQKGCDATCSDQEAFPNTVFVNESLHRGTPTIKVQDADRCISPKYRRTEDRASVSGRWRQLSLIHGCLAGVCDVEIRSVEGLKTRLPGIPTFAVLFSPPSDELILVKVAIVVQARDVQGAISFRSHHIEAELQCPA